MATSGKTRHDQYYCWAEFVSKMEILHLGTVLNVGGPPLLSGDQKGAEVCFLCCDHPAPENPPLTNAEEKTAY